MITSVAPGRSANHHESAVILPGIVNAHSHLEYAVYAGFGDGLQFGPWLRTHIERKGKLEPADVRTIARRGALDSLRGGITTTADYSFSGAAAAAANEAGLRAIVYLEVFGSDPNTARQRFDHLRSEVEETDLVAVGISPHAPYTCSIEVYEWCMSVGVPVGTHLAESPNETEWLMHGTGPLSAAAAFLVKPTGKRPVETLGPVLGPDLLCAHCVTVDAGEITMLAELDVPIAHCPRSNALLGCGTAPLVDLRAAGIRVGLGTDSPASTPSIDPWAEMRATVAFARAREQRPDALLATDALQLATLGAADAIGRSAELGSLTVGKKADLTALSLVGSPYDPVDDPIVASVFGGSPERILETVVDGTTRYRQGDTAWHEASSTSSAARRRMLS